MSTLDERNIRNLENKGLTEDELTQVSGGARRTDDEEQYKVCNNINFALFVMEENPSVFEGMTNLKNELNDVSNAFVPWRLPKCDPYMRTINNIITELTNIVSTDASGKAKEVIGYLNNVIYWLGELKKKED